MQVCEEALKVLRNSRRRAVRAMLHVSGDGLRVVEEDTKGLIVDQTIEKVSFCAPDRNHERGFSYVCRDGTTRRWMCHGFLAARDPGERLSHAVGCAFSACLERKQRRDKDTMVAAEITRSHHHKILHVNGESKLSHKLWKLNYMITQGIVRLLREAANVVWDQINLNLTYSSA